MIVIGDCYVNGQTCEVVEVRSFVVGQFVVCNSERFFQWGDFIRDYSLLEYEEAMFLKQQSF